MGVTDQKLTVEFCMGAWGYGIRQDDFVMDVVGAFKDFLKASHSVPDATKAVMAKFADELKDPDDGPLFWIALADAQWTYGELDLQVLNRVKEDYASGRGLGQWREEQADLSKRLAALKKFISKIEIPNPRPRKLPKIVVRAPLFLAGDCLSIRLSSGQWAAALVLVADHSDVEYGKNLIGVLDYLSPEKPTLDVYRERKWLVRTHHRIDNELDLAWYMPVGFRSEKSRIEVVGRVEIRDSDPKTGDVYAPWALLGEQIVMQRQWDANGA